MDKEFNVTGLCLPAQHYMVAVADKLAAAMQLIAKGKYFAINRPRQFGKTTLLNALAQHIWSRPEEYVLVRLSFEGVGDRLFTDEERFAPTFVELMAGALERLCPAEAVFARAQVGAVKNLQTLSTFISHFVRRCGRPVIVLIDEVDKSSNNQLFLSFLGLLRNKYLDRDAGGDETFHAVVLAGIYDIKTLKLKIRPDDGAKQNSPWNIASDFDVDLSFTPAAVTTMLKPYAADKAVTMDFDAIAARLCYYTSGHPFLVSNLCKILDEKAATHHPGFMVGRWTTEDVDWAFRQITSESYTNANFDDLIKNLETHPELMRLTETVLFGSTPEGVPFSLKEPVISLGVVLGLFRNEQGRAVIHNRIYEQVLLIFDFSKSKHPRTQPITFRGKTIFAVWV